MTNHCAFPLTVINLALLGAFGVACSDAHAPGEPIAGPGAIEMTTGLPTSEIAFVAAPNATCNVYEPSVDRALAATVYSDDQGVVRLYASPTRPSEVPKVLSVECDQDTTDHVTRVIDLADRSVFRSIEPSRTPINRTTLPPLGDERDSIPIAKLLKDGYPPRPDSAQRPEAYARWVSFVSHPISVVQPKVIETDIYADPGTTVNDKGWGGTVLNGAGPYLLSDVTFTIPQIPASPVGRIVMWGGLRGGGLIQNGIDLNARGSVAQYNAFYEYWHNNGIDITNFSVRPGDLVESWAYPTDNNFNWNGVGTYGCFGFNNITQGTTCTGLCMASNSNNPPFTGNDADFILEPQSGTVPNIGKVDLAGYAWAAGGRYADMSTDPYSVLQLTNKAGTRTLVQAARINPESVFLTWLSGTR
jgi:hypothetical protein